MSSITAYLQGEYNMKVLDVNQDGTAKISYFDPDAGEEVESDLDYKNLLAEDFKASGKETTLIDAIPFSSAEAPLEDNALSFSDRFVFAKAKSDKDKQRFLSTTFGEGNFKRQEDGSYITKTEDGNWRKADSGAVGVIAEEALPVTAGILAGVGVGAISLNPVAGGAAGATAYAAAKAIQMKDAVKMGIRTDLDAETAGKELSKEFLTAVLTETVGVGAGLALKAGGKATANVLSKGFKKLGSVVPGGLKNEVLEQLAKVGDTSALSMKTAYQFPDDIANLTAKEIEFNNKIMTPEFMKQVSNNEASAITQMADSPSWSQARTRLEKTIINASDESFGIYERQSAALPKGLERVKAPAGAANELDDFFQTLVNNKVARKEADGSFSWIGKSKEAADRYGQSIVQSNDFNVLRHTFEEMKIVQQRAKDGVLTFGELRPVATKLNTLMKRSKVFEGTNLTSSQPAYQMLAKARSGVEKARLWAAKEAGPDVAEQFTTIQNGSSRRMEMIADLEKSIDPTKIDATLRRLLNTDGQSGGLVNTIKQLVEETGGNPHELFNDLAKANAAREFSKLGRPSSTGLAAISSVAYGPRATGWMARQLGRLTNQAKVNMTVKNMTPAAKEELLKNPQALKAFSAVIDEAPIMQEQMAKKAVSGIAEAVQTGNTQAVNQEISKTAKGITYQQQAAPLTGFEGNISKTSASPYRPDLSIKARESNLAKSLSAIESKSTSIKNLAAFEQELAKPNISAGEFNKIINKAYKAGASKKDITRLKQMRPKK